MFDIRESKDLYVTCLVKSDMSHTYMREQNLKQITGRLNKVPEGHSMVKNLAVNLFGFGNICSFFGKSFEKSFGKDASS